MSIVLLTLVPIIALIFVMLYFVRRDEQKLNQKPQRKVKQKIEAIAPVDPVTAQSVTCQEVKGLLDEIRYSDTFQSDWRDARNPAADDAYDKAVAAKKRLREMGDKAYDCIQALAVHDPNSAIREMARQFRDNGNWR